MSEVEEQVAPQVALPAASAQDEEEASPAAVRKPAERIKRPVRPDDEAYKQKVDALQDTIQKNKKRGDAIKQQLEDRRAGRSKGSSEQQALKSKLAELRGQFQAVLKQKVGLREQMEAASKTRDAVKTSLRDLKSNMKFTTVEQIDEAIAALEHRVQHSSLTLNEEKRVLEDIRALRKSRAAVGAYSDKLEALAQDDSSRVALSASIKSLDEELGRIRAQEDELRGELGALREKEAAAGADYPALQQELQECREVCKQAYEKIQDLRAGHDAVWQEFKDAEKAWRAQAAEERAARQAEWDAERAARDAERAARAAENAPEPFDKEVTTCEQLAAYLQRFVAAESAPEASAEVAVAEVAGMRVLKKADEGEYGADAWLLGKGGKKGKGKGKKGAGGAGDKEAARAPEKLVHSLDMIGALATLGLATPTSAAAVPALLAEVATKKEHFLQRRAEVKEKGVAAVANGGEHRNEAKAAAGRGGEGHGNGSKKPMKSGAKSGGGAGDALKLDDVESWPAMGAGAGASAGAANAEEEPEEEPAAEEEGAAEAEAEPEAEPEPEPEAGPVVHADKCDAPQGVEAHQPPPQKEPPAVPEAVERSAPGDGDSEPPAAAAAAGGVAVVLTAGDDGQRVSLSITRSED